MTEHTSDADTFHLKKKSIFGRHYQHLWIIIQSKRKSRVIKLMQTWINQSRVTYHWESDLFAWIGLVNVTPYCLHCEYWYFNRLVKYFSKFILWTNGIKYPMHMWDNKSHDIYFMGLKTLNCYLRKKWVFKPHIIFMGFSAPWGLLQNPMGFAWGFLWGIFSKLKSHGVGTFKFKYLKNYLKMFQFFFHKFI